MNYSLKSLKASALTNMEFGQLMNKHLNDITVDQVLKIDQPYMDNVRQITDKMLLYERGLAQVQKNAEQPSNQQHHNPQLNYLNRLQ